MSPDPHAPTPAGPDPDEGAEAKPTDPFAPPVDQDPPAPEDPSAGTAATNDGTSVGDVPSVDDPEAAGETTRSADEPPTESTAALDAPVEGVSSVDPGGGMIDPPPSATESAPAQGDWLKPDSEASLATPGAGAGAAAADAGAATPEPDPVLRTPSAFTPLGTPDSSSSSSSAPSAASAKVDQAKAFAERPEGKVALAFVGGVVLSFILKRLGR